MACIYIQAKTLNGDIPDCSLLNPTNTTVYSCCQPG